MAFFTFDNILNPYYPRSIIPRLPQPVQRILGGHKGHNSFNSSILLYIDVFIGTFCSILLIEGVFKHSHVFISHHSPIIIASYGASAVLVFNANGAPLSQPRNVVIGHFLSGLVGVILSKLFELSESGKEHLYVGGALSVSIASIVMSLFNCVHPPSGASALIPLIDDQVRAMGWWYLPAHLVMSVLMVAVACITNNVIRRYPLYWWTSYTKPVPEDVEKQQQPQVKPDVEPVITPEASGNTLVHEGKIEVGVDVTNIPEGLVLNEAELEALRSIQIKLNTFLDPNSQ